MNDLACGIKQEQIAVKYGVNQAAFSLTKKAGVSKLDQSQSEKKRQRTEKNIELDGLLLEWFTSNRNKKIPLSGFFSKKLEEIG